MEDKIDMVKLAESLLGYAKPDYDLIYNTLKKTIEVLMKLKEE